TDSPWGQRPTHTLQKLPTSSPRMSDKAIKRLFREVSTSSTGMEILTVLSVAELKYNSYPCFRASARAAERGSEKWACGVGQACSPWVTSIRAPAVTTSSSRAQGTNEKCPR